MLTGCLLENICYQSSGVEAIRACSEALRTPPERTSALLFFLASSSESEIGAPPRFFRGTMGMSGSARQGSHREGILLPVTMNRKPSPPPEPTQTFDVKGGSRSRCGSTAHSCLGCLATSPHHASQLRSDGTRTNDLRRQQTETTEAPAHVVQCLEDTF